MYGLALGGGGSRGAYEIGVLKALEEMNIEIGAITGTSIGAVNAAGYLMGDLNLVENIWRSLDKDAMIKFKNINIPEIIKNRGFDFDVLMNILTEVIKEDVIRKNPIDLGIVTYNVTQKEPVIVFKDDIPEGRLIDYIAASANHPTFQRMIIDGNEYMDGAVYDNIPIQPLYNKGYRDIISVNLDTVGIKRDINYPFNHISIKSNTHLGSILFPDHLTIEKNISYGYMDTLRAFKNLHGYKYSFRVLQSSSLLSPLTAAEIKEINASVSPLFFNKILESYRQELGIDFSIVLASLEITAEVLTVDDTIIYESPNELLDSVVQMVKDRINKNDLRPLADKVLFRDMDPLALNALSITNPKYAITNIFLKIIQNRLLGD
ncbi:MAG: patatin-like phospholipase family protein [Clostridiaceae bacterium]